MNYSKTIIYKIEHNTKIDLVYVGHTTDFNSRKKQHKSQTISHPKKLYVMIRENGGWESFIMVAIMEFPCENKIQACIQEEKCRKDLQATMNDRQAHTTPQEHKEIKKKYKKENHEHILADNKRYYQENIEKIKQYRESRKEKSKDYKKDWYEKNKDEINAIRLQKYTCECGIEFSICNKLRHERSKRHQDFITL
jgi:DNA mismatch repair ATPase MutL